MFHNTRQGVGNYNEGKFLTVEHINAQSVLGNMDEIMLLVKIRSIDILCVSESSSESPR